MLVVFSLGEVNRNHPKHPSDQEHEQSGNRHNSRFCSTQRVVNYGLQGSTDDIPLLNCSRQRISEDVSWIASEALRRAYICNLSLISRTFDCQLADMRGATSNNKSV